MQSSYLPTLSEVNNLNNLTLNKPYQNFDYSKYINEIKYSNFAHSGGAKTSKKKADKTSKNIQKVSKQIYIDYMCNKCSHIKKMNKMKGGVATLDFPIKVSDTYNLTNLNYNTCFQNAKVKRLSTFPQSNFSI